MRCHVALTPAEAAAAPLGIVVDVMRATSTIAQALASGYERVLCCAEIEDALALKAELGDAAITAAASATRSGSTPSTRALRRASSWSRAPRR